MAPPMVLLDRKIYLFYDDEAVSGGRPIRSQWEGRNPRSRQEKSDSIIEYLRTFKPIAELADPPEVSFLHILRPLKSYPFQPHLHTINSAHISSADKHLVALYAGGYRPGSRLLGGYLIYDAKKNSFSVIPEVPCDHYHRANGFYSAVVMCKSAGDGYVLAELVNVWPDSSEAELWLWESSAQEWVLQPGTQILPSSNNSRFSSDLCFSYRGSFLCWVDLFKGMVLCDLGQNCKFSFIELPKDCPTYDVYRPIAEEFRSMACVHGEIKFVVLDESDKDQSHQPRLQLTVWTLSPDLSGWNISTTKYDVGNIWANEAYKPIGKTKVAPQFPVLSIHEDGVIYLVLNDITESEFNYIDQSLLRVDMVNNKIQFYPQGKKCRVNSQLVASEFSLHRQRIQDHPREIEGSEFGASGKRMKP